MCSMNRNQWDEVTIDRCLELKTIAATRCSVDDLRTLNPELLRNVTPAQQKDMP